MNITTSDFSESANILLVDDDDVICMLIQRILENIGHHITCVKDGEKALELFEPGIYDLLITDVVMPKKDGFEVLADIKKLDPKIDVIMITGAPTIQLTLDAMRDEQVADFIVKPFDKVSLRQAVTRVLRGRRMRQYNRQLGDELNHTLEQQATQISLLQEIVSVQRRISASLDKTEVFQIAVQESNRLLECDWSAGLVLEAEDTLVVQVFMSATPDMDDLTGVELPTDLHPLLAPSAYMDDHAFVRLIMLQPDHPLAEHLGIDRQTSLAIVPLVTSDKAFDALLLAYEAPRSFKDDQLVVINLLAQQLVLALVNAGLHAEMQVMAAHDSLTGLFNRRELMRQAEEALAEVEAQDNCLAVLMLDIDNFKRVNDTYGHIAGDEVLKMIGNTCRQSVRQFDLVGRYGGEEFMIVLVDSPPPIAVNVAKRIWQNIGANVVEWDDRKIQITASLGVAISTPEARLPLNRLIVAADESLYSAKQAGRNRIVLAWE